MPTYEIESHRIKIAQTAYPIHPLIAERWSARSFSDKPIEKKTLFTLFEAARWAPSSMNEQPWRYVYAFRGTIAFEKLWNLLMTGNQPWCKHAAVLVVSIARLNFAESEQPNRHALYDTGAANQNLLLQAMHMGIYGHLLGGYHHEEAVTLLGLRKDETIACMIALGYLNHPDILEEPFKTRELTPRHRKDLEAMVEELYIQ